ncbi:RNA-binding protein 5-like isoform X2 [Mercenaria mercenaria]|uniref:RNA-binding protein 5-like isoform X2 n=1 Tax=Mercenaria mercenaria TaxID=6596 RepID=UPI001E1D3A03|nr:RNA-binding protein 5-like isoform X2 [Mercenaria mercenaria]
MATTDYPNPYENTGYHNYQDPYTDNQNDYNYSDYNQSYSDTNGADSYGSDNSYGGYQDTYNNTDNYGSDHSGRSGDQEERDRQQRKNRSERRREMRSGGHDRHRDRDSSRNRDRRDDRYDRDRRDRDNDDRAGEKWVTDTPSNTVILQRLPSCIEEKDIKAELMMFGAPIRDVRLMRKSSGASRGFAFVEFQNRDDAVRWMDSNQKKLILQNQYTCTMNFSTPKDPKDKQMVHRMDWTCVKCGVHNFKRRDYCFKCNMSRYESGKSQADGYDHVGTNPCNTLVLRGLDALTTEESILRALNAVTQLTCKNIQVVRDATTQASQGFAFVELGSVAESVNVLEVLKQMNPPLEVDGKQILVAFAKNTFTTSMATINAAAQQSWDQSTGEYYQNYDYSQYDQSGYYSGQYYDGQNYDYSNYYSESGDTPTTSTSVDSTNAAAAVAQAAIQQAQAAKHYQKQQQQKIADMSTEEKLAHQAQAWKQKTEDKPTTPQEHTKYPAPDVSLYQYDETSGYYYDPVTTLYYDASSQYYYNSQTGGFMYWDAEQSTYLPAPTDDSYPDMKSLDKNDKKDGKDKKEKVKVAKKIAKDMEKWAKSMNAQKEAVKDGIKKISMPNLSGRKESATADAGFAILEKVKNATTEDKKLMPPPPLPGGSTPTSEEKAKLGLVASYGGDSDDEDEDDSSTGFDESKLLDHSKKACLLCKRQFQSKEQLIRHAQMSDLHKQNLESLRQSQGVGTSSGGSGGMQYRDRAKERREKIGSLAPPPRKRPPPPPEPYEQPTKAGLGSDNIGSKMLQKMGWSSGQGLGRSGQGIVNPIEAERRNSSAGLGMRGSKVHIEESDNYKDALKKTLFARYNDMD